MNINNLQEILHKNFNDDIRDDNSNEDEKDNTLTNIPQTAEKFRFEKETSTVTTKKNRKSLESSAILSNLSLQDVFNSTNKKLLDKNSHLLQEPNVNIILEEDSNFNLNTFNLKTNFNNFEFDYANLNDNQMNNIECIHGSSKCNVEKIQEEIADFIKNCKNSNKKRKSQKRKFFPIEEINENIRNNLKRNKYNMDNSEVSRELDAIIFYEMLILAQNGIYEIFQEKPFEMLFTI